LAPEDINKPYFKIKCWISDNYNYYSIKYFQKDGTRIILQLADFKTNIKIKDSFFIFDKKNYTDVEIVDMRD
jgi:outer membrane lipoprotein-sorting protein